MKFNCLRCTVGWFALPSFAFPCLHVTWRGIINNIGELNFNLIRIFNVKNLETMTMWLLFFKQLLWRVLCKLLVISSRIRYVIEKTRRTNATCFALMHQRTSQGLGMLLLFKIHWTPFCSLNLISGDIFLILVFF